MAEAFVASCLRLTRGARQYPRCHLTVLLAGGVQLWYWLLQSDACCPRAAANTVSNLLGHSMLLSPLVIYKSLSAQAFQQWSRQLLSTAAHRIPQQQLPSSPQQQLQQQVALSATVHELQFQHMTTSQKQRSQLETAHHLTAGTKTKSLGNSSKHSRASAAAVAATLCSTEPSSSSNGSEHFALLDRPPSRASSPATASTKSAKRKAAEALLAAQYGGLGSSGLRSNRMVAPNGFQRAGYSSDAAAAAVPAQATGSSKRPKSMLSAAITRLGGQEQQAAEALQAPAAHDLLSAVDVQRRQRQDQELVLRQLQEQRQQRQRVVSEVAGSSWQQAVVAHVSDAHDSAACPDDLQLHLHSDDSAVGEDDTSRHVQSVEAAGAAAQQLQRPTHAHLEQPVVVPACGPECSHTHAHGWCHSQVKLPHVDWGRVLEADMYQAPSFKLAQGYERLHMPGGVQVLVVEQATHIPAALAQLRSTMQDPVVAIDLEWRPEFGRGFTPVAMVQLASSRLAVLIRTCRMGYRLPQPLKDFFADPQVHLLGFSWANSDEGKMVSTFGVGQQHFGRFMDLQQVAQGLGYHGFGLARLTRQVLGINMPKNKKISMSNWECTILSHSQVKYAALDVLMAGQVFRALRLWHSSPSLCEVCHYNLGTASAHSSFTCSECQKQFWDIKSYVYHCERCGHKAEYGECEGCGCARGLPWPSSTTGGAAAAEQADQPSDQHSS